MGQSVRFQEILRRLAIIDESFVEDQARLRLGRVTGAVPEVAAALGYDVDTALMDQDDH
jgi:hypothetical protein